MTDNGLLIKLDRNNILDNPQEIRLICNIRNEITRLPFWFNYYRNLGVSRFFFIDDHSTDGTTDFLLSQPDTHVFNARTSYREANSGTAWQNELLDLYGTGHWTIVADADELLAYRDHETVKLPEFCAKLDREGSDMLYAFLLDLYPQDLSGAICNPGKPFYEICNYFDSDYKFVRRFGLFSNRTFRYPEIDVIGGVRMRIFYPEQLNASLYNCIRNRLVWKACNALEKMGFRFEDIPHQAPALYKVPLVKWRKGYARLTSHHITRPVRGFSENTGVLMHFKFFADFHEKAKSAARNGQYFAGSREYRHYLKYVSRNDDPMFVYEGSIKYTGSECLADYFNINKSLG